MSEVGRQRRTASRLPTAQQALALAAGFRGLGALPFARNAGNQRLVQSAIRLAHEQHRILTTISPTALSSTSTPAIVQIMNATIQGSGGADRTGRKFVMESYELNLNFNVPVSTTLQDVIRVILIIDSECRGALPVIGDYLQNTTFGMVAQTSPRNFDNMPRFRVLLDEIIIPKVTVTTITVNLLKRWNFKLKTEVACYNTSVGSVADIEKNSMVLMVLGTNTAGFTTVSGTGALIFRDR